MITNLLGKKVTFSKTPDSNIIEGTIEAMFLNKEGFLRVIIKVLDTYEEMFFSQVTPHEDYQGTLVYGEPPLSYYKKLTNGAKTWKQWKHIFKNYFKIEIIDDDSGYSHGQLMTLEKASKGLEVSTLKNKGKYTLLASLIPKETKNLESKESKDKNLLVRGKDKSWRDWKSFFEFNFGVRVLEDNASYFEAEKLNLAYAMVGLGKCSINDIDKYKYLSEIVNSLNPESIKNKESKNREYVVRIVNHANGLLEHLRYAGIIRMHQYTSFGTNMFDLYAPKEIADTEEWAKKNAERLQSFGFNAVMAPRIKE